MITGVILKGLIAFISIFKNHIAFLLFSWLPDKKEGERMLPSYLIIKYQDRLSNLKVAVDCSTAFL